MESWMMASLMSSAALCMLSGCDGSDLIVSTNRGVGTTELPTILRLSKDYEITDSERRGQLKNFLNTDDDTEDDYCLDALDILTGGSADLYGCFKEHYNRVEQAYCEPPRVHQEALDALRAVDDSVGVMKGISGALKSIPTVGTTAKTIYNMMKNVEDLVRPRIQTLENMKKQPHGTDKEDSGCCQPSPAAHKFPYTSCSRSPGASYKCASCNGGEMCNMQKGCNSVRKFEGKLDEYFETFMIAYSEAAQVAQAGENAINEASWLWDCEGIGNTCSSLKDVAEDVASAIRSVHDSLQCPWNFDLPNLPDLGGLNQALSVLKDITDILDVVNDILEMRWCVPYPTVKMERQCVNLVFERVCMDVPIPGFDDWCFTAKNVLDGLDSALKAIPGVSDIIKLVEDLIDDALKPVYDLLDELWELLVPDITFDLPDLPSFDFSLPNLPELTCELLSGDTVVGSVQGNHEQILAVSVRPVYQWRSNPNTLAFYCIDSGTVALRGTMMDDGTSTHWGHFLNLPVNVRPEEDHLITNGAWNDQGWEQDVMVMSNGFVLIWPQSTEKQDDNLVYVSVSWPVNTICQL